MYSPCGGRLPGTTRSIRRVPALPSSPARGAPDACPGALQLHPAADGLLARIRCPGGLLTAVQLRLLAAVARDHGDGHLELTSRANVQVRAVAAAATGPLAARLRAAGLLPSTTHERVRNILGSALADIDTPAAWDVGAQVRALDAAICAEPDLARLSGRFLFAVDDGRGDTVASRADVGLLPGPDDDVAVLLAGSDHGLRSRPADAVRAAVAAARAFLDDPDAAAGSAWRLDDLTPAALDRVVTRAGAAPGVRRTARRWQPPTPAGGPAVPVGVRHRPDGGFALVVAVPLGRLTVDQVDLLAAASPQLRITPWRGMVLPRVTDPAGWADRFTCAGLVTDPGSPWLGVTACAGLPGCARSRADVRADAAATHAGRPAPTGDVPAPGRRHRLPVHWIGCERGCGTPAGPVVRVTATGDGYQIDVPDRTSVHLPTGAALGAAVQTAREEP
ncbi:precorrin-3B synthase [Micromonospora sp. Llam0]|nr:precorrin-3B synthase [Micromonospora sp. Llam0]